MAKNVAESSGEKKREAHEESLMIDADAVELDGEEVAVPRAHPKDPTIRRKIEDLLERKRLREELGLYDDDAWDDL